MNNIDDLNEFREKTQNIQKTLFEKGWDPNIRNAKNTECFIYLYDVLDTGYLYMMAGKIDAFEDAKSSPIELDVLAGVLGTIMKDNILEPNLVVGAGVSYFAKTETYRLLKNRLDNVRGMPVIIVLRYGHPKLLNGTLRPFALLHPTGILSPREVMEEASMAINADRKKHPEWFPVAEVVPIKPKVFQQ